MRLAAVAALLVALAVGRIAASAVVVFRSPARLVFAADSRRQDQTGRVDSVCKIRPAGRWWFTVGGFTTSADPAVDVMTLTARALAPAVTLTSARDALVAQVYPKVHAALSRARSRPGFAKLFEEGAPVMEIVVGGTEPDAPTVVVAAIFDVTLKTVEPLALPARWLTCPGLWCPDGRLFHGASVATATTAGPVVERITPPRVSWVERGDAAAALRIIREQIAATPRDVRGPVDVLEVTAGGARWVERERGSLCGVVVDR